METYFSVYNNDNWWIYKNQDSTKTDSVFVTDFNQQIVRTEKEICTEHIEKKFNLHSTYYYHAFGYLTSNLVNGLYTNTTDGHTDDISCGFHAHMSNGVDALPTNSNGILYDSLLVGNRKYFKVIYLEDYPIKTFHAPNVGMLKYIYQTDTFTLRKYHLN
jgi:hypothetical protein